MEKDCWQGSEKAKERLRWISQDEIKPLPSLARPFLSHHSILPRFNYHLNYLYILVCYLHMVIFFSPECKICGPKTMFGTGHLLHIYLSKNTFKFIKHSAFSSYNEQNITYPSRLLWRFNEIMSIQCTECQIRSNVILTTTKHHRTQNVSSWLEIFLKSSTLGPFTW